MVAHIYTRGHCQWQLLQSPRHAFRRPSSFLQVEPQSTKCKPCPLTHSCRCMERYTHRCTLQPSVRPPCMVSHACKREPKLYCGGEVTHSCYLKRFFYYVQYDPHFLISFAPTISFQLSQRSLANEGPCKLSRQHPRRHNVTSFSGSNSMVRLLTSVLNVPNTLKDTQYNSGSFNCFWRFVFDAHSACVPHLATFHIEYKSIMGVLENPLSLLNAVP